jgi:hypothetical protein
VREVPDLPLLLMLMDSGEEAAAHGKKKGKNRSKSCMG